MVAFCPRVGSGCTAPVPAFPADMLPSGLIGHPVASISSASPGPCKFRGDIFLREAKKLPFSQGGISSHFFYVLPPSPCVCRVTWRSLAIVFFFAFLIPPYIHDCPQFAIALLKA